MKEFQTKRIFVLTKKSSKNSITRTMIISFDFGCIIQFNLLGLGLNQEKKELFKAFLVLIQSF